MTKRVLALILCIFVWNAFSFAQTVFHSTVDLDKKPAEFYLVNSSGKDSMKITVEKKSVHLSNPNEYIVNKKKKCYEIVRNNADTFKIVRHRKQLEFQGGYLVNIVKFNERKMILADSQGNIILDASLKEKKGKYDMAISVNQGNYFNELLSLTTYHLYNKAVENKQAAESAFLICIIPMVVF